MFFDFLPQIKGSGGLLNKITFTGEDVDFLHKRQRALEVSDSNDLSQQNWSGQHAVNAFKVSF